MILLIVLERESSGVAAGIHRASRRYCFVVDCRLVSFSLLMLF